MRIDLSSLGALILLYLFHQVEKPALAVKPYLEDQKKAGFATRHPARPNPIGLTVVRLLRVDETTLHILGMDMLDGSPLLDIKPFVPAFDHREGVRCGWHTPHLEATD